MHDIAAVVEENAASARGDRRGGRGADRVHGGGLRRPPRTSPTWRTASRSRCTSSDWRATDVAGAEDVPAVRAVPAGAGGVRPAHREGQQHHPLRAGHAGPARARRSVDGVINLRGRVDPGREPRAEALRLGRSSPTASSRIVVAEGEARAGRSRGRRRERGRLDRRSPTSSSRPRRALTAETAEAFEGVARHGDRLIILLDLDKALPRGDYESSASGDDHGG